VILGVRLVIGWAINVLALIVADWAFDSFAVERWGPILLAGAVLALANVFLKPLVTFIALPLILLTFGLAYFFVNVVMLLFAEWVTPDFSIDGFWTYVGATIVIWLVNWIVWTLVDMMSGDSRGY
jgi:putative membrane protein